MARLFDGTDDSIDFGRCSGIEGKAAATFGAWIYQTALTADKAYLTKWDVATQGCFFFQADDASGNLKGAIANSITSGGQQNGVTTGGVIAAATWAHAVWVFNSAGATNADRLKCYVNNVAKTLSFLDQAIPTSVLTSATATVKAGRLGGTATRYWNGRIADLVIYDHALTLGEIAALYAGHVKRSGLVLYAPLWGIG